jgi:excinuclease ABC subunit A
VTFKGKSVADVLDMTVDEGTEFFKAVPTIRTKMETLRRVGLGYIHVGQAATTLSGGEAQRVKLAKELSRRSTGRTLYILDEPTTGLHFEDVRKLLEVLHALVGQGNTVLVIEHNLEIIKNADWIVDLGPDGGDKGGRIVAAGTPEDVAATPGSYTGQYLAPYLPAPRKRRKRA